MLRLLALFALFLVKNLPLFGQEQLGLRLERFSGISSAALNPANLSSMAVKWDATIAGAAFFVESDYGFIKNSGIPRVLRTPKDSAHFFSTSLATAAARPRPEQVVIDYAGRDRSYYGDLRALAMLPSFAVHIGERHSFGFSTNAHLDAMTHSVPPELGYPRYDAHPRFEEFEMGRISVAAMAWSEAGLHYSHKTELENGSLAVGGSLRFLLAHEAVYARSDETFFLTKIEGDSLIWRDIEFEGGVTTTNFPTVADRKPRLAINGRGLGIDLGVVFQKYSDDLDDGDYPWQVGLSVLDIGKIGIGKNSERHTFYQDSAFTLDPNELGLFTDPHEPIRLASARAHMGDPMASLAGRRFAMGLPMAVCAQADFRAAPYIYVNGTLVQRIDFRRAALQRPNILAVTPRFEQRWWSASAPFLVSEWRSFRFGLAARLGFLTIGTDDLGAFFRQKRLNSADFYLALKINALRLWGEDARQKTRDRRRDRVNCYDF